MGFVQCSGCAMLHLDADVDVDVSSSSSFEFFEPSFVQVARLADGAEGGEAEQGREQGGQGRELAGF